MPNKQSINYDPGTRLQALALAEAGIPLPIIQAVTQLSRQSIYRLKRQARERGFDPAVSLQLKLEYVVDRPRSGRPRAGVGVGGGKGEEGSEKVVGGDGEGSGEVAGEDGEGIGEVADEDREGRVEGG